MDTTPKYDLPWELISESFTGSLSEDNNLKLQQWLESDPANKKKYDQLRELWEKNIKDYKVYRLANENKAWGTLQQKIEGGVSKPGKIIQGRFGNNQSRLRYIVSIAALFLAIIAFWFIFSRNNPVVYETTAEISKKIILNDGSDITLGPQTRIEVSRDYNETSRTLWMTSGNAKFNVTHLTGKPFIVKLGNTQVVDIGTSFTINKGEKEIKVSVASGKVVFIKLSTSETKELPAGTSVTFNINGESFGEIRTFDTSQPIEKKLKFNNTPLSEIITRIQSVYGKKIIIGDPKIANKKMNAELDGMPYNKALEVICKSLKLEYTVSDSVYVLKAKSTEQP